jgi:hypothetical protein
MTKGKDFELVPKPVPARRRAGFYTEIVAEFLKSGERSVLVAGTDRKPGTLMQGLRKALAAEGVKGVKVLQRSQEIFLAKS